MKSRKKSKKSSIAVPNENIVQAKIISVDNRGALIAQALSWPEMPAPLILIEKSAAKKYKRLRKGDIFLIKIFPSIKKTDYAFRGHILAKMQNEKNLFIGLLNRTEDDGWHIIPIERDAPKIFLLKPPEGYKENDLVKVKADRKQKDGKFTGTLIKKLGETGPRKALSRIALLTYDIPHNFSEELLEYANSLKPASMKGREDWRNLPFLTIDPADAKDRDDAVYAKYDEDPKNAGGYVLFVAIADVSYYIKSGSLLDFEAYNRSNSVYFPDAVVPMLPERISNHLCSLEENQERPALGLKIVLDKKGYRKNYSFHRVMLKCQANLSYEEAQYALDNKKDNPLPYDINSVLQSLWTVYKLFSKNNRGSLNLEIQEYKIALDSEGIIKDIFSPKRLESHKIIEEFMIQANVCAAEILKEKDINFLYRVHDRPSLAKSEMLRDFLKFNGFFPGKSLNKHYPAEALNKILQSADKSSKANLIHQVILRAQSQAEYSCENIGHFGLHLTHYTHFTSPIRRYADLTIHRNLIQTLKLGEDGHTQSDKVKLSAIATHISANERRAMKAERETVARYTAFYLSDKIGEIFQGSISGLTKAGLFVQLDNYGIDGFIPASQLPGEYFIFDEMQQAFIGSVSGNAYQLGDKVEVTLLEVQALAGTMRLQMLSAPINEIVCMASYDKKKSWKNKSKFRYKKG